MAPSGKARGESRSGKGGNETDDRVLTPAGADRLATDLGLSEGACDVLSRWAQGRWNSGLAWLLTHADAMCLAQEVGISGKAVEVFCVWLRLEMFGYHLAEGEKHEPTPADICEEAPQLATQLRGLERRLRERYLTPMVVHEVAGLPKSLKGEEADKAIEAAKDRVEDDLRAFSSIIARLDLFRRASGRRSRRTKRRPHDHILAERALTFWDEWLRDQGVRQDLFCRLVLGLVGVSPGSIETFVRDARKALRAGERGRGVRDRSRHSDYYELMNDVLAQYLDERGS